MQHVGFVVFPNFQAMGLAVISTFEFANLAKGEQVYKVVPPRPVVRFVLRWDSRLTPKRSAIPPSIR